MIPRESRQNDKTNTYGYNIQVVKKKQEKAKSREDRSPCLYRLRSEKILERTLQTIE